MHNKKFLLSLSFSFASFFCNIVLFGIFFSTRTEKIAKDQSTTNLVFILTGLIIVCLSLSFLFFIKDEEFNDTYSNMGFLIPLLLPVGASIMYIIFINAPMVLELIKIRNQ